MKRKYYGPILKIVDKHSNGLINQIADLIVRHQPGVLVVSLFTNNPAGNVIAYDRDDDTLYCEMSIDTDRLFNPHELYVTPKFSNVYTEWTDDGVFVKKVDMDQIHISHLKKDHTWMKIEER